MDVKQGRKSNLSPWLMANALSRLSFWWLNKLFFYGRKNDIKTEDLYDVLPEDLSESLGDALETSWESELKEAENKNREPSLWNAIISTFGWSCAKYGFSMLLLNIVKILVPVTLALLIRYFDPRSTTTTAEAYMYATGLVVLTFLQTVIQRHAHFGQQKIGMRIRIACSSLIYRKVIKLSSASASRSTGGILINLLSNDVSKFEKFVQHLHYFWIMPLLLIFVTCVIWWQVGVVSLVGIAFMIMQTVPTQVYWYKITSKLRAKTAARTDKRVLLIGEIINGIRVIKMYAWEKYFEQLVYQARRYEIDTLLKRYVVKTISDAFAVFTHRLAMFSTILVCALQSQVISADKVFAMVQFFYLLRLSMAIYFPDAVSTGAEVNVSVARMQKFLLLDEKKESSKCLSIGNGDISISIKKVDASWVPNSTPNLHGVELHVPFKKLYAVVGPVASGKSSLLKLILGELQPDFGDVFTHGKLSYAGQESWLFTGSVKDNILFGEAYDEKKYAQVTKSCALIQDFVQLPHGDKTLVGERGTALSGGQCARINLARAVYRDADIYLLDDPLSAVDAHVGETIFHDCINGFLKNKTRLLVTHQIQYLKEADTIILLNKGYTVFEGTFQNLRRNAEYLHYLPSNEESGTITVPLDNNDVKHNSECDDISDFKSDENKDKDPKLSEELSSNGKLALSFYTKYFKAGTSYGIILVIMLFFVINQICISGFDYWLGFWTKQEDKHLKQFKNDTTGTVSSEIMELSKHSHLVIGLSIGGALILSVIIISNVKNLLFYKICLTSSKNIHNNMFAHLAKAPMQFFQMNPSGRIVNRFTKDTGAVDETLPVAMKGSLERIFYTIGILFQILIINWWTIFPMLLMLYIFLKMTDIYISTVQDIKRLEGNAKSPVFSLVNSSLLGLSTIRASEAQKIVRKEFDTRQDNHTAAHFLVLVTSTAFGFWLDMILTCFLILVTYSFIALDNSDTFAGDVGLALTQILAICGTLQSGMKLVAEVIAQMTNVERMFQYTKIDQESPSETIPDRKPKEPWPNKGEIEFKNLHLRYSKEDEPILRDLNFTIEPKMKIGIVGRTGAGKSSLISALFRLARTNGSVFIDGVDTQNIGLPDLRSKISIIPQEPMLFTASLRDNLDPFHQCDDAQLWSILEEVELKKIFDFLDYPIKQSGNNISAGQRQLLCLARAIIKKNKILVLDEATANVDPGTDEFIQKTIRRKFKDCTVLTIAHRLNTIMDSDRVLVMDNGKAVEFDQPHVLLQQNDGYFSTMVNKCGNVASQHLKTIAEKTFIGDSESHISDSFFHKGINESTRL